MNWSAAEFWIDGGCRGNHANGRRQAYGSISDGTNTLRLKFPKARTNNEAEYLTLAALLQNLPSNRPQTKIYTDSKLLVDQLSGTSKVKASNLLRLHDDVAPRLRSTGAKLIWVPRPEIVKQLGH